MRRRLPLSVVSLSLTLVVASGAAAATRSQPLDRQQLRAELAAELAVLDTDGVPTDSAGPGLERARALKAERARGGSSSLAAASKTAKTVKVDCTKGQSIQSALDGNPDPLVIEIHGVCAENVRIVGRQVTLRGADRATDGIRGVSAADVAATVQIWHSSGTRIERLSMSDGPAAGLAASYSFVELEDCSVERNGGSGIHASTASSMFAVGVRIADNDFVGFNAQRGALAFCDVCEIVGNGRWAGVASRSGLLSIRDSVVSGDDGIFAFENAYADIDCLSAGTGHPCSLAVNRAGWSFADGTAAMYGVGDFAGQLFAVERGHVYVYGSRQTSTGTTPSGHPRANIVEFFGTLILEPFDDGTTVHESRVRGHTSVGTFGRAVLLAPATVDGSLGCSSGGDAWTDPGVVLTPGSAIFDCEHAPPPGP